ncbi:MAG: hypothetical protein HQM08_03040 [Candidatus Riflebacteria bacterium]|nr:hypothetical protein [Candidatus Riflebacteria bacterium]
MKRRDFSTKDFFFLLIFVGLINLGLLNLCAFSADEKEKEKEKDNADKSAPSKKTTVVDSPARQFINQGQSLLSDGRISEAKEALRTAIRLDPMSLEAWGLYDRATESLYTNRLTDEKTNPALEGVFKPNFSIEKGEMYYSFGTLYIVGELKNISGTLKNEIELSATLYDENRQELRRSSTPLTLKDRGLFPNESSLFEIPFPNPPIGIKSYRIRVSNFE